MKKQKRLTSKPTLLDYISLKINNMYLKIILILLLVLLIGALMVCWPLCIIWAINNLFSLKISYTVWNWLAVWILVFSLQNVVKISNKN